MLASMSDAPQLSLVIPIYCEEEVLPALIERTQAALDQTGRSYEIVFVDDGSEDRSTEILRQAVAERRSIRLVRLSRNFGLQSAVTAGLTHARGEIVGWLRQRSRPYLFSNSLAPAIAAASLTVLDMLQGSDDLRRRLRENSAYFRKRMTALGFTLAGAGHPIIPVMLGDAKLAGDMAEQLLGEGIYVIGFSYPVVPVGQARIRTQMSAALSRAQLDRAIAAFAKVGRALGVIAPATGVGA